MITDNLRIFSHAINLIVQLHSRARKLKNTCLTKDFFNYKFMQNFIISHLKKKKKKLQTREYMYIKAHIYNKEITVD